MCIICDAAADEVARAKMHASQILTIACNDVHEVPDLPNITKLNVSGCMSLRKIGALVSVVELRCRLCFSLSSIGAMPKLRTLDCDECTQLRALPELPAIHAISAGYCPELRSLPHTVLKLMHLFCVGCVRLRKLPRHAPILRSLRCDGCTRIKHVPNYRRLQVLSIDQLRVTHLPPLPALMRLECNNCPELTAIATSTNILNDIFCYDCPKLRRIHQQPDLSRLSADGCISLTDLPILSRRLVTFSTRNCPFIVAPSTCFTPTRWANGIRTPIRLIRERAQGNVIVTPRHTYSKVCAWLHRARRRIERRRRGTAALVAVNSSGGQTVFTAVVLAVLDRFW
jgi:hypothetical protein